MNTNYQWYRLNYMSHEICFLHVAKKKLYPFFVLCCIVMLVNATYQVKQAKKVDERFQSVWYLSTNHVLLAQSVFIGMASKDFTKYLLKKITLCLCFDNWRIEQCCIYAISWFIVASAVLDCKLYKSARRLIFITKTFLPLIGSDNTLDEDVRWRHREWRVITRLRTWHVHMEFSNAFCSA